MYLFRFESRFWTIGRCPAWLKLWDFCVVSLLLDKKKSDRHIYWHAYIKPISCHFRPNLQFQAKFELLKVKCLPDLYFHVESCDMCTTSSVVCRFMVIISPSIIVLYTRVEQNTVNITLQSLKKISRVWGYFLTEAHTSRLRHQLQAKTNRQVREKKW